VKPSPSPFASPPDRLLWQAGLLLFGAAALGGATAGTLHWLGGDPDWVDRVVPLALAAVYVVLLLVLWRRPARVEGVLHLSLAISVAGLALPTWWHLLRALEPGQAPLIETLPPLPPTLVPLALVMTMFLRRSIALRAAALAWAVIGAPVLVYLLAHPDELLAPRGQEMALVLGPVMLLVLAFIPIHRAMERRVAALQEDRARMQALAERDPLTGAYNRRAAEAHLASLQRDAARTEVILFDIDHFKSINDRHGHGVGDSVLCAVAARCGDRLATRGVLARWGGEEFLVLADLDADGEGAVAESLRRALAEAPIEPAGRVTASFGSTRLRPGEPTAAALQRADEALYEAKRAGRDRVALR
jgi:diguanylate cyclase (GGDEF)-like protein